MSFTSYTLLEYPGIEQSIYQSIHRFVFGSVAYFASKTPQIEIWKLNFKPENGY